MAEVSPVSMDADSARAETAEAAPTVALEMQKIKDAKRDRIPLRVLVLDGGGVRGVVLATVLAELEKDAGRPVCELFDLIVGTSTGGILAILVGLLKLPARECIQIYHEFATEVFDGAGDHALCKYDVSKLEDLLTRNLGVRTLTSFVASAGSEASPRVAVVAKRVDTLEPSNFLFRSYDYPQQLAPGDGADGTSNALLRDAARATSAAPSLFAPYRDFTGRTFIDGAVGCNNPTGIAVAEALKLGAELHEMRIVLSLGTGKNPPGTSATLTNWLSLNAIAKPPGAATSTAGQPPANPGWSVWGTLKTVAQTTLYAVNSLVAARSVATFLSDASTETEDTHAMMKVLLSPHVRYERLNPPLRERVELDERRSDVLLRLEEHVRAHVRERERSVLLSVVEECTRYY